MKYLILLFITLPAFAGQYETCEKDVAKIRKTPAKLISDSDYDKMLEGCTKYLPKFEDTTPIETLPAAPKSVHADPAEIEREFKSFEALNAKLAAQTDAELNRLHQDSIATERALSETSL